MRYAIELDNDTSELYEQLTQLTGLSPADLIRRQLSAHHAEGHELLALVTAHPELREQAANLLQSYGPEPLFVGIERIAPRRYATLGERFERDLNDALGTSRTVD